MSSPASDARDVPVGRLAPSPTGHLHIGHARSFLLAWWHARSRGGRIVLRLEDLDEERVKPGMSDATLRDLEWLGLDWDGPVIVQSQGLAELDAAVQRLIDAGLAYPCVCTRKEIQASQSAPHIGEEKARYPGTCRGRFTSIEEAERESGRAPAVRFRVPPSRLHLRDAFSGPFESDVEQEAGDFPIARRAGMVAYQLAVVVDDARAGVNEIVRGDDLLSSTGRQFLLQEALHVQHPRWYHVPLVVDVEGRRFAKRSDDLSLERLRKAGTDPRTLVAWIGRRSGMEVAEPGSARDFLASFSLNSVPHSAVVCGPEDLAELGIGSV